MGELLIFGGTTEGRLLAEFCAKNDIRCTVSVATEYGAALLPRGSKVNIGRLDCGEMSELIRRGAYTFVVDATHPYAAEATRNIEQACTACGVPRVRLLREQGELYGHSVGSLDEMISFLNGFEGVILSTLGSKALPSLAKVRAHGERVWVRLLPSEGIFERCAELGFDEKKIIAERGPFSVGQNTAHIRRSGAGLLVTKDSGAAGGYPEKTEAAKLCGTEVLTLARPSEQGLGLGEVEKMILSRRELFV